MNIVVGDCLDVAGMRLSSTKHAGAAKRVPLDPRPCAACGAMWTPLNSTQAKRNRACSRACGGTLISAATRGKRRKPPPICQQCAQPFRPKSRKALSKVRYCSNGCRGAARAVDPHIVAHLKSIAHLGHKGWTAEGKKSKAARMSGANNHAWKGGVMMLNSHGLYMGARYTLAPLHLRCMARRDGWIMEHRLVMALWVGRPLTTTEVVHHVDHYPRNNVRDNLELWPDNSTHKRMEHGRFCEGACNRIGACP